MTTSLKHESNPTRLGPARIGWALFALQVAGLLGFALHVYRAHPMGTANAALDGGQRFRLTEQQRRDVFRTLMEGEQENRDSAEKETDGRPWNRNRDSYFHQHEWGRILWQSRQAGVRDYVGWLILDEGLRGHWAPPPGVPVLEDEAPLARTTPPMNKRRVLIPAPPKPVKTATSAAAAKSRLKAAAATWAAPTPAR